MKDLSNYNIRVDFCRIKDNECPIGIIPPDSLKKAY